MIQAGIGRYGPYVNHDGVYANLPTADEVFEVGLNRAVAVLAEKRAGGRGRPAAAALAELGPHPTDGEPCECSRAVSALHQARRRQRQRPPRADPAKVTMEEASRCSPSESPAAAAVARAGVGQAESRHGAEAGGQGEEASRQEVSAEKGRREDARKAK